MNKQHFSDLEKEELLRAKAVLERRISEAREYLRVDLGRLEAVKAHLAGSKLPHVVADIKA